MTPRNHASDSPRWEGRDWLLLLGYLAIAHLIFYPALRPGVFLYGRDTTAHDFGLLFYNWSLIADNGQMGLWNPDLFCGLPSLGTFASCPFYPVTWLFALLSVALAFAYQYILNNWLAGWWTYWAARWMGLRRTGAFFAGMVFMVSGHVVTLAHAGHLQKVAAIAWMPFVFGCATAALRQKRWGWWAACGVGLAAQLLASHVQIAYYTVLFLILWILWLERDRLATCPTFSIGGLFLALVVAGGLSAAQILPSLETMPLTNRGAGIAFDEVATTSYPPFEFMEYLLPSFLGDNTGGPDRYWGEWGSWGQSDRQRAERIASDYMGLLPLILMMFGLAAGRDRNRWFWLAVMLIAGVLAAGGYMPFFRAAFRWLPGFNRFRSPGTIMVFIAWPAAILAARGFEEFADRLIRDETSRWRYALILAAAAAVFALLFFMLVAPEIEWPFLGSLSLPSAREAGSRMATVWTSLERSLFFAALSCAALAALAAGARWLARGTETPYVLAYAAVLLLAFIDPRLHESRYIKGRDVRPFQVFLLHHWSDAILQGLPQPVRGIETGNEYSNRMMTRGIGSLHGYHPVHLQEYLDLLDLYAQNHSQLGRLVFEQFILAPEAKSPGREYEKRAMEEGQVLWLRRPPLLYAYFPRTIEIAPDRKTLLAAMARPDFDPYRCSYSLDPALAYASQVANVANSSNHNSTATARVVHYSPDRIDLEISCDEERPMVVAELAVPGWQWVLDSGERLAPATANYAFRAARIPAGNHRIALIYRPFSFRLGLYLTLASVFIISALVPTSHRVQM